MTAAILAALGVRRLHLTNFSLFFAVLVGLSCAVVAVFMATRDGGKQA